MLVLMDMDGVLADFELAVWRAVVGAGRPHIPLASRSGFAAAEDYRDTFGDDAAAFVREVIETPGFYADLDVVPGAVDMLERLECEGHDVWICTAPLSANPTCASDKLAWTTARLGARWRRRVIITSDKTLVRGDVLVDDKPGVSGALPPTWTQLLVSTPQNEGADGLRVGPWDAAGIDALADALDSLAAVPC